jgi:hypothetical protein
MFFFLGIVVSPNVDSQKKLGCQNNNLESEIAAASVNETKQFTEKKEENRFLLKNNSALTYFREKLANNPKSENADKSEVKFKKNEFSNDEFTLSSSMTLVKRKPLCSKDQILLLSRTDVTANPRLKACLHFGDSNDCNDRTTPILDSIKHNENFHKCVTERRTSTPSSVDKTVSEIARNHMIKSISNMSLKNYADPLEDSEEISEEENVSLKIKRERSNSSIASFCSKQEPKRTKKKNESSIPLILLTSESESSDRELLEYLES